MFKTKVFKMFLRCFWGVFVDQEANKKITCVSFFVCLFVCLTFFFVGWVFEV